ncbi:MAG: hypothetical protein JSS65_13755 [Armatimonadetes bacterium]|nr:hypothetical protein [Armatimonadota bacterium]
MSDQQPFDPSRPPHRSVRQRYAEAFKENGNLIGLATAAALSIATFNPIPLLVGIVGEVAYLLFVPDSAWFTKRLDAKFDAEVIARRKALRAQVLPQVRPDVSTQFDRLERVRDQIQNQAQSEQPWFREALRKLDYLLEKYLQFAQKEAWFCEYLDSLLQEISGDLSMDRRKTLSRVDVRVQRPPTIGSYSSPSRGYIEPTDQWVDGVVGVIKGHYDDENAKLAERMETEQVYATKAILQKRQEILNRRHEYVGKIAEILSNLGHQMALMADTFGLINDEIRARSPEQVLADIDEVVIQTNSMTEAIEAMTPLEDLVTSQPITS